MSRYPLFQTKIVAGRLVTIPTNQHNSHSYASHHRQYTNDHHGYMAAYSRNQDVDDLSFYRQGRSMNWTANIEAQSNKARALAQTYHSVLSPEPEEDTIIARPSALNKGIIKRVSVCLDNVTDEKLQTSFYTIAKLDGHHTGIVSVRDLWDVLLLYQIIIPADLLEVIIAHFKIGNGKIDYRQLWKFLYDCLPHKDYSDGDVIPVRDSSSYYQTTSEHHHQSQPKYSNNNIGTISKLDPELFCQLHEELKCYAKKEQHLLSLSQLLSSLKNCDRSGTGIMGFKEMKVLCNFYLPLPDSLLDAILISCDNNKNGWVNYLEFLGHMQSAQPTYLPPIHKTTTEKYYQDDSNMPDLKSVEIRQPPATASGAPHYDEFTNSPKEQISKANRKTWKSNMSTPGWVMRKALNAKLEKLPLLERRKKWENCSPVVSLRTLRQRTHSVDDLSGYSSSSSACSTYRNDSLTSTRESAISQSEIDLSKINAMHIESLSPEPDQPVTAEPQRLIKRRGTYTKSSDIILKRISGWIDNGVGNPPLSLDANDEIIFSCGPYIVLLNIDNHQQRFYTEHITIVQCFCALPNKDLVASAENGPPSKTQTADKESQTSTSIIHIWRPSNLERIATVDTLLNHGIVNIGFLNKDKLLVIGQNQQVNLWEWHKQSQTDSKKIEGENSSSLSVSSFSECFLTINKVCILFWNVKDGSQLSYQKGNYKSHPVSKSVTCGCFISANQVVTGDTSGSILIWNKDSAEAQFCYQSVHSGSVSSLIPFTLPGTWLSSSLSANSIAMWMKNDKKFTRINLAVDKDCGINSMTIYKQKYLVCCLTNNTIFRMIITNDTICETDEGTLRILKGLSHPITILKASDANTILIGCKGGFLHLYQRNNTLKWSSKIKSDPLALETTSNGKYILCGTSSGRFHFLDVQSGRCLETCKLGTVPIKTIFASADDNWVCVGFGDGRLSLFELDTMTLDVSFTRQIQLPSSEIEAFDWSDDNRYARFKIKNHDIKFFDLKDGKLEIKLKNIDSVTWTTDLCKLQHLRDTYVCTAIASNGKCRAYGHNQGMTLVRYTGSYPQQPVSNINIGSIQMVSFSSDGSCVYGVRDNVYMEWEI